FKTPLSLTLFFLVHLGGGAAGLTSPRFRVKPPPTGLVQGLNVTFLVQFYGHAAAKPDGNAGRSP
ncbi:hypothetical protein, partial [Salmonella enterica]|uniref:hypothetical protein n=1 Tax=Salmonella enterica TaxID=28901 RepID=UPI003AB84BB2